MNEVKVGIIGFGTVGAGVAECLLKNGEVISKRTGIKLKLSKVADLDIKTGRRVDVPKEILTENAHALIEEVDVVVELVGGTSVAKDFILEALEKGKPVVTANKALLAENGKELFAAAEKSQANIYYEASVAGGIPIIKALREGLSANRIEKIYGIMNGTCNYIFTRMENEKIDFETVLAEAQKLGYAEADPTLDIEGYDTAHKAVILASLAYGEWFGMDSLHIEGISNIRSEDIRTAAELGYKVKLLAVIKQEDGDIEIRVHPTLVPASSMIGSISGVFNGVMVVGDTVGETLFYGKGAGREATASAVVSDITDVALNLKFGSHRRVPPFRIGKQFKNLLNNEEIKSRYYISLLVQDKYGVMANISKILGNKKISISSIIQREVKDPKHIPLIILTHECREKDLMDALNKIRQLDFVNPQNNIIRIEDI